MTRALSGRRFGVAMVAVCLGVGCAPNDPVHAATSGGLGQLRAGFPGQAAEVLDANESFVETNAGFELQSPAGEGTWRSVEIVVPKRSSDAIELRTPQGFAVHVREVGAAGEAAIDDHAVSYARQGGKSYWASGNGGVEEWLRLQAGAVARGAVAASWEVSGGTLVQAGDVVEVVDGSGIPQMRVDAPKAFAAGGREVAVRLGVSGDRIELFVDSDGEELLVDPGWSAAASMGIGRDQHTATLLGNGKVLVVGGFGTGGKVLSSAELYNPATNSWSPTPTMPGGHCGHTATVLTNGKVLVTGSYGFSAGADLYDPATNSWSPAGSMSAPRYLHTATRLANGKVLIAGGQQDWAPTYLRTADVYDPATNSWSPAAQMSTPRRWHAAILLGSGKVLVAGGDNNSSAGLSTAELYDPAANTWVAAHSMATGRSAFPSVQLGNGKILVAGGQNTSGFVASAELYDPAVNIWSVAPSMASARFWPTGTLLGNGKFLVAGGQDASGILASTELYDPTTNAWSAAGSMATARLASAAALLGNGKVLEAGGAGNIFLAVSELYTPASSNGLSCSVGSDCSSGFCVGGICCDTACAGACGTCGTGTCTAKPSSTVCQASAGACDTTTYCDGAGTTCPAHTYAPAATLCHASAGACDTATYCTGSDPSCPPAQVASAATVCYAAQGVCDTSVYCDGSSPTCPLPASTFQPAGTVCTAATPCEQAATCTGSGASCPPTQPVVCSAPNSCHDASCDPSAGCEYPLNNSCTPTCVTIERGILGNVADADLRENLPNQSGGLSADLVGGYVTKTGEVGRRRFLLQFDLGVVPAGMTITSAALGLQMEAGSTSTLDVHRVSAPWAESTVTWNSFAGSFDPTVEASFSLAASYVGPVSVDLTSVVGRWYSAATPNDGVAVIETAIGTHNGGIFASSEAPIAGNRPKLTVCYSP